MKTQHFHRTHVPLAASLGVALLSMTAGPARLAGATYYWDTDGATAGFGDLPYVWGLDPFWSTNATGGASTIFTATTTFADTVNFGTTTLALGPTASAVLVAGTVNVNRINIGFAQHSPGVTLTAGTLVLGGTSPLIAPSATNGTVINSDLLLATNAQINTPTHGVGGQPTRLTVNGAISGPYNVTFHGANGSNSFGTIVLNQKNTYGGNTLLQGAGTGANLTLQLGVEDALPPTTVLTLDGQNGSNSAAGRHARLELNGFNQTLAGLNNVARINVRFQQILNTSATPAILTINNTTNHTYTGQLGSGTGNNNFGLTKKGPGRFTLSPANTNFTASTLLNLLYAGPTTIEGGILEIGARGRLGNGNYAAPISITAPGSLVFSSTNANTLSGPVTGTGGLTNAAAGTLTLVGTNDLPHTTAAAGTLAVSGAGLVTGTVTVEPGGTLSLTAGGRVNAVTVNPGGRFSLPGAGTVNTLAFVQGGSLNFDLAGASVLTVAAPGGLTNGGPAGSVLVNLNGAIPSFGTYDLIFYTGPLQGSGFSAFQLGATPGGASYTLVDTGTSIQLVVAPALIWTGLQSSEWSTNPIAGFKNWSYLGGAADYANGQAVIFDDTIGFGSTTVDLSVANVTPASVFFENNVAAFTLQGSASITGAVALTKAGSNTLAVLNPNPYTGPTFLRAGTLQVGNGGTSGSLGSGPITADGALEFNRADALTVANGISGNGSLRHAGAGVLTLAGANTYAGPTLVDAGTLRLGASQVLPDGLGKSGLTVNGTLDLNAFSETLNGLAGAGTVDSLAGGAPVLTVGSNNASSLFGGVIRNTAGSVALNKVGSGTLVLSNFNSYGGGTVISNGIITAAFESALGTGPVRFEGGTRLAVAGGVNVTNPIVVVSSVGVVGRGTFEPVASTVATISGPITLLGTPTAGGHFATTGTGALLDVAGPITASVPVAQRIGTIRYSGGGSGYTNLALNQGAAIVGAPNGIAPSARFTFLDAGAGTLDLNGFSQSLVGLTKGAQSAIVGNGSTASDATLILTGDSTFGGTIQDILGTGTRKVNLEVNGGAFTLSSSNAYTGNTIVNTGSLLVNGILGASPVTVNAGGLLGGSGRIGGQVTLEAGGTLSPGTGTNAGRLYLDTTTQLAWFKPGSTLVVHLNGTNAGAHDQLLPKGDLFLEQPTLQIILGYAPTVGDQFTIVDLEAGFLDGTFAGIPNGGTVTAGGYQFQVQYGAIDGNAIVLTCIGAGLTPPTLAGGGPLAGTSFPLSFSGPAGQSYQVLTSTNVALPLTNWTVLSTGTFGAGPATYTDTSATNQQRFYLIKSP
ncbi:MAG: hypothetical protein RJA22_120 [Verrucomicrobiota bacterium]